MMEDWKAALARFGAENDLPAGEPDRAEDDNTSAHNNRNGKGEKLGKLNVVVERKGRGGKVATIIEGFECSDERLQEIASQLKRKLGVGGSARGGEILIQGNLREKVIEALKAINN